MHYRNHSDTTPIDQLGRRRASAKLGWYLHAGIYIAVNILLAVLSAHSGRNWAVFPALGWGLGLVLHGVSVFLLGSGDGLRERMVQREREALQREQAHKQQDQHRP